VEVRSSSRLVPTIYFNHLATLASFPAAPNGSLSAPNRKREDVPHFAEADLWPALTGVRRDPK
jgi:hypothetical protein